MGQIGVIVANEPLAYREALATAVQALRPQVAVTAIAPTILDDVMGDQDTQVVICSALTETIRRRAIYWVVLYPDAQTGAHLGLAGQEMARDTVQLDDLLAIIDEAGTNAPAPAPVDPGTTAPGAGAWARVG